MRFQTVVGGAICQTAHPLTAVFGETHKIMTVPICLPLDVIWEGMIRIVAVYGSPRRNGNTAALVRKAVQGARAAGAHVEEVFLRDLTMSPCLEIYGCRKDGRCVIQDDFGPLQKLLLQSNGMILGSPIFFYSVTAHTKILMDRCQSLWVKKYWIDKVPFNSRTTTRKGIFISVGATRGRRLFDGAMLSVKYFFDVLDMELLPPLLFRGLDMEGDVLEHPDYLLEAQTSGAALVESFG